MIAIVSFHQTMGQGCIGLRWRKCEEEEGKRGVKNPILRDVLSEIRDLMQLDNVNENDDEDIISF